MCLIRLYHTTVQQATSRNPRRWSLPAAGPDQFQGRLAALREKWGIEEGHDPERVWKSIVEKDNPQEGDYLDKYERGQTHHQLFEKDLAELASEVGLGRDSWWVLPYVLVSSTSEAPLRLPGECPPPVTCGA